MNIKVKIQLMLMMFLMFFTWGAWYGQMSKYMLVTLHANGDQVGNAYTAFSIATIIAPFFVGMIADRFFSAQKVMGILNILGAIILFFLVKITDPEVFFWYILAYTISFTPNLALSTSIAMNQMKNPEKEFPFIRVLGTIAWIVVTNIVGILNIGDSVEIFQISMFSSLALGVYAFTLPDTPPKADKASSVAQILGTDAFVLFKDRSFLIFFISSILICIPLSFYYALANPSLTASNMSNVENKMSLGQVSEIFFMLILPFAFSKFGVKNILLFGLVAWIIRFICFGYGDGLSSEWILYIGILLHGICYDFFFVTGQIYTDNKAGEKIKNSAQGLITFATYGLGMGIGSKLSGIVLDYYKLADGTYDYRSIWMVPAYIAFAVLILFFFFFRENTRDIKLKTNL
ncbi:nucleoside permease [Lacihabitans lacunae]|uniref:Nucleoside permease n=1 Tax=Lacihabitans lacunae TaxID=1028214 RepID=A0ABV7YSN8_9BACT